MTCPRCSHEDIGTIRFAVVASGVDFSYCRRCEHRWWTGRAQGDLPLDDILEAATVLARAS